MVRRQRQDTVDLGVGGVCRNVVSKEDPDDADRALCGSPLGDRIGDGAGGRIDRLHQPESGRMRSVDLFGVAGVIAIHRKRRDQDLGVDADGVHRGHDLVAGLLRRSIESAGPGAPRMIALIGVDLSVDRRHILTLHETVVQEQPVLLSVLCRASLLRVGHATWRLDLRARDRLR
jgi:hypothetical protein